MRFPNKFPYQLKDDSYAGYRKNYCYINRFGGDMSVYCVLFSICSKNGLSNRTSSIIAKHIAKNCSVWFHGEHYSIEGDPAFVDKDGNCIEAIPRKTIDIHEFGVTDKIHLPDLCKELDHMLNEDELSQLTCYLKDEMLKFYNGLLKKNIEEGYYGPKMNNKKKYK